MPATHGLLLHTYRVIAHVVSVSIARRVGCGQSRNTTRVISCSLKGFESIRLLERRTPSTRHQQLHRKHGSCPKRSDVGPDARRDRGWLRRAARGQRHLRQRRVRCADERRSERRLPDERDARRLDLRGVGSHLPAPRRRHGTHGRRESSPLGAKVAPLWLATWACECAWQLVFAQAPLEDGKATGTTSQNWRSSCRAFFAGGRLRDHGPGRQFDQGRHGGRSAARRVAHGHQCRVACGGDRVLDLHWLLKIRRQHSRRRRPALCCSAASF